MAAATAVTTFLGLAYAAQGTLASPAGSSLDLSRIDARLQQIAEAEVRAAQKRFEAKSVAVVVAQPKSGTVVAFAEALSDPKAESWATREFPPASTTKPFVVAAALESGAIAENQALDCPSPYEVDGKAFHNHDGNGNLQKVSATEALAQSVNVCTIKMAQAAGKARLQRTLQQFGIDDDSLSKTEALSADDVGAVLGVSLRSDLAGMVRAYSMLANDGRSPAAVDPVISEKTAASVVRMLVASVDHGTGRKASLSPISVAGKTGTAVGVPGAKTPVLGMFAGFAPADAPQLVAFVIVEGETGGGAAAAPTFRELMRRSLAALEPASR